MAKSKKNASARATKRKPAPARRPVAKKRASRRATAKTAKKKSAKKARKAGARPGARPASASTARKAKKARSAKTSRPATVAKAAKKAKTAKTAKTAKPVARKAAPTKPSRTTPSTGITRRAPALDRERRTIREVEPVPGPPSSLNLDRSASSARSGRHDFNERLRQHTSTGPAMTAGDVDADWEDAETVGDEAPGGDNPTPDQDIVEEIGEAIGITYHDNEELKGGDELVERDRHRWELDPASREDYGDEEE